MFNLHSSSAIMMAVIWPKGKNENFPQDETLQYLLILCTKVGLNTFVLSFWRHSILKSLLGLCSVSMYAADMLLVCAVSGAWLFKEHLPTSTSMCFILAHGSAVYALLPLPILIAGAFDYASYPNLDITRSSRSRVVSYCIMVVLMWASAFVYTYHYTDTEPTEIYKDKLRVTVCRVHGSTVVFQFNMQISIAVGLILLLYFKKLIGWLSRANKLAELRSTAFVPDQDFPYSQFGECGKSEIQESSPPFFVSLTLGFAVNWAPYLLMCLTCAMVGFVVPAYASVNLLWMACANSVLVGIAFWFRSDKTGPYSKFPDETCFWNTYWQLSKGILPTVDTMLPTKLYRMVHKPTMPFQEI
ncbi:probable G-protein coupled receptor 160 [Megalobrama amblycephala]|uniref:probable G-protein coupled receptor 160 n=1 Tax=Megalobrama amblycephala TaxID=75352 RepID=UPI002013CF35|nr:probable G-protein coupled receptor 160 [Megalobrama amblycephala]